MEINRSRQIWISFEPSLRKGGLAVGKKRGAAPRGRVEEQHSNTNHDVKKGPSEKSRSRKL